MIVIIGLAPLLLAVASGASFAKLQPLSGGLLLVGGGAKLIHMGTAGARSFWLVFLLAVALTFVVVWLVPVHASETSAIDSSKPARMSAPRWVFDPLIAKLPWLYVTTCMHVLIFWTDAAGWRMVGPPGGLVGKVSGKALGGRRVLVPLPAAPINKETRK
ncbi:MAG: hypothetical protein O7G32_08835 [SAR324 cluster bacterium]|nr:hypothetical protein [SAR324 cluster bacterium]